MPHNTILITGASRGIGRAVALEMAPTNCNLILACATRKDELADTAAMARELGCSYCHTFVGDLGDPSKVRRLFGEIAVTFGGADILINNAGISLTGLITSVTDEDWMNMINSNLSSVFYCCRGAVPYMVKIKQGRIINISSVWGTQGASCEAAYSATKAGINGLTKALAKELAPSNIQVNAIAPGVIDTEMNSNLSDEERKALEGDIPAGRYAQPQEIAQAVHMLCDAPSYVTGQIITASGGWNI